MGRLASFSENIKDDWLQLRHSWQNCRSQWNDGVAREFEHEYWQAYENALPHAIDELEKLDALIQQARDEVE